MKLLKKSTLLVLVAFLAISIIALTNNVKAATSGHYTYEEKSDGTIGITKYDGTAAENLVIPSTIDGKTVTSIESWAFKGCSGLTGSLTIPNSLTSIEAWAFEGCSGLTGSLTIPNSLTSISLGSFSDCSGLTEINVLNGNSNYCSQDGILFNKDKTELIQCPGGNKLNNYSIPNSVTSIESEAFYGCSGLTGSLTIPNSVTSIGWEAFYNCSGLTGSLTIPNSVTSIGSCAFYGCSGLTGGLTIPNSITSIEFGVFYNCSGLTGSLTIPNSVTSIEGGAFAGCSGLTGSLTIPNSVTSIEGGAFEDCSGLTGSLIIPDGVKNIGACAFYNCRGLTGSLTIPNSVTSIGDSAFEGCSGLTGSLTIPNSVTSIEGGAFEGCSGLTGSLTIPNSVTSIGDSAFEGCSGLTGSLTIPNSVTSIGRFSFRDCTSLTGSLTIPNSVTSIGQSAFSCCSSLTGSLTIPNSVTSIGNSAFSSCSSLTGSLTIPNSVTSIEACAFAGCENINKIVFVENAPEINSNTFLNYPNKIYYRKGTTGYTQENGWPASQLSEYDESLKQSKFTINSLELTTKPKIELNGTLSSLVDANFEVVNTSIAKVEKKENIGYITPLANGTTDVKVLLKYSDSVERTLIAKITVDIKATGISLNKTTCNITNITKTKLIPTIKPANTNNKTVKWTSSNENIATVDSEGNLTSLSNGTCKITATTTDGTNLSASCDVTVDIKATGITTNITNYTITTIHDVPTFRATITPTNAKNKTVKWSSSNTNVATVSESGVIKAVGNGTCKITATTTDGTNLSASVNLTVGFRAESISLDKTSYTFNKNESLKLTAAVLPDNTNNKTVKWESSNKNVAIVNSSGMVSPVGKGTCTITATTTDGTNKTASCNITSNVDYLKGDINKDGRVNMLDVYYGMKGLSNGTLTEKEIEIGDVTYDGRFNMNDVNKLLKYIAGKIESFD